MTVEVYDGPGVEDYRSTRYTATVQSANGDVADLYVYGVTKTGEYATAAWGEGDDVEASWLTYGTDETNVVSITKISGAIASAVVYPKVLDIPATIVAGVLVLTVPTRSKLMVVIDGDAANALMVFADPLKPALAASPTTFVDVATNPTAVAGETLYFPAGVHTIGKLYPVEGTATVYLEGGAWLIGTFDMRGASDVTITGPGVISGEFVTDRTAEVYATGITWAEQIEFCPILGRDERVGGVNYSFHDNYLSRVTIVNGQWHAVTLGPCYFHDVKVIQPWHRNSGGFTTSQDVNNSDAHSVWQCFLWTGDDNLLHESNRGTFTANGNFLVNSSSASIQLGYWPWARGGTTTITQTYILRLNNVGPAGNGFVCIKYWSDGELGEEAFGRFDVTIDGMWVEGLTSANSALFSIQNKLYPWGATALALGDTSNWSISNVHCEYAPTVRSELKGLDASNTPHDFDFFNIYLGGTRLTSANWSTYVDQNDYPYDIRRDTVIIVIDPWIPPIVDPGDPIEEPVVDPGSGNSMSLTVEDGTLVSGAESYISVADATTYHANYGNPVEWSSATTAQHEGALRQATAYLDDFYKWKGVRSTIDQALHWPRYGVIDTDNYQIAATTIPEGLKRATAVAALKVLQGIDLMPDETGNGSTQSSNISVGPITISESYGTNRTSVSTSFVQINRLLRGLIITSGGTAELSRA